MSIRAEWLKSNWVIILTIIWFAAGFVLLGTYRAFDWRVLTGFATWFLAGGVGVAIWQIVVTRETTRKSTSAQVAAFLFQALHEDEAVDTLKMVYSIGPAFSTSILENDKDLRRKVENVLDNLELMGALVTQGIFNEKMAIEAYSGPTVLRCWYVLKEYIEKVRCQRGGLYGKYLEDFAWRTWEYQRYQPPKEHIRFYQDKPSESFDLVQYLNDNPDLQPEKKT
jgi:hypothetical protein